MSQPNEQRVPTQGTAPVEIAGPEEPLETLEAMHRE
jgi:hypothetical protein